MTRQCPGDWLSATAAARWLGVSTRTLRRYTEDGKLPDVRGGGGRRIFQADDLDALTSKGTAGRALGYTRVSCRGQQAEGNLDCPVDRLREHGGEGMLVFTDVASGTRGEAA